MGVLREHAYKGEVKIVAIAFKFFRISNVLIGAVAGILLSIPLVYYFYVNPLVFKGDMAKAYEKFGVEAVLPAAFDWDVFVMQALVVFCMTSILALYPIFKIKRLEPVKAMRA